uniref:Uncharacterized protein n=1 Tax=viral metagenome TaxID=1070528 RepID=A0A6C0JLM3_9ZZZZ
MSYINALLKNKVLKEVLPQECKLCFKKIAV